MVCLLDTSLEKRGFHRENNYVGVSEKRVRWKNWKHEIEFVVRTDKDDDFVNDSSIGSYSTEEHDASSSSSIFSDSDREYLDGEEKRLFALGNRLGGMSDIHMKALRQTSLSLWMRTDGTRYYQWFLGQRFHIAGFAEQTILSRAPSWNKK